MKKKNTDEAGGKIVKRLLTPEELESVTGGIPETDYTQSGGGNYNQNTGGNHIQNGGGNYTQGMPKQAEKH